ncbi:MAG: SPL family radical SAM protein [Candidatus Acidiferrales bacterium]
MSPVLSSTARTFGIPRRHVKQSTATLFPVSPYATSPKPRADDSPHGLHNVQDIKVHDKAEASAVIGLGGSTSGCPTADCPPPTSREAVPHSFESCAVHRTRETAVPLVGIARLAACSPPAESHRKSAERPEYFLLPVKSILNRCDSARVPFDWTINPYRGCEFGCLYCYARYTHEYMELDGGEFERKIFVKKDAGPLLAYDVARKYSYASESSGGEKPEHIAIGTATDPYQPAEREYGVTRACLEELSKREGLSISVITKSNQIVRDIDVLKRIAERSELSLNITVTTLRPRLARLLEPRAPRPDLRIAAVRQLREAGLRVGVSASPLIPGITDREGELEAVAEAAHKAGAQWFFSGVLFLMPSSAKQFLPFIREKFPRLTKQYEEWYTKEAYAPEKYRKMIAERVARLKQKYGFDSRPQRDTQRTTPCAQMKLAWDPTAITAQLQGIRSCAAGQ